MRIYVCSPYAAKNDLGIWTNVEAAKEYCRAIFEEGHDSCAPHLFYPQFCDDKNPDERARCMEAAKRELLLCDGVMVFGDELSSGMKEELDLSIQHEIPVYEASKNDLERHVRNAVQFFETKKRLLESEWKQQSKTNRRQNLNDPRGRTDCE